MTAIQNNDFFNLKSGIRQLFGIKHFNVVVENRSTELTTKSSAPTKIEISH